ncbi:RimK family alpha-L-glutamate ligase [Actibacterium sp. 188UL27-1]|uniref:ATP-grasp domain-containing protein n=1 Tax=Actibacterium sp. 188UL27-1 TaxID=2786961 RepID=UPI00195A9F19|nr:hypothetical protein [Actibacterium sp. 188UL27-1]MBM7068959.1 hypothetical protein [Actibacterium sp. 188UL27-1]
MVPQTRIGLAQLTSMAFNGADLGPLRSDLAAHCLHGADSAGALMDLSVVEQLHGNRETGLHWQSKAFETCRMFRTWQRQERRKKLLVFAAPIHMGGNTPVEFLMRDSEFEVITYYPNFDQPSQARRPLPDHDIAFCAAPADAEGIKAFFDNVRHLTDGTGQPVLNSPEDFIQLDRDMLDHRFRGQDGLRFPKTMRVSRHTLLEAEDICRSNLGDYPHVIRPVGSHAGMGLRRIASKDDLMAYLAERDEPDYYLCEFINYASPADGQFRKYRVVFVDSRPFPVHMAVSDQWDVWYMNAKMADCATKRGEEAAFMASFDHDFARRHQKGFEALTEGIGLDYFGVDCAEDAEGNLVVFEADNALIVHDMDCEVTFPYKAPHMRSIFAAFEEMLLSKCHSDGAPNTMPDRATEMGRVQAALV